MFEKKKKLNSMTTGVFSFFLFFSLRYSAFSIRGDISLTPHPHHSPPVEVFHSGGLAFLHPWLLACEDANIMLVFTTANNAIGILLSLALRSQSWWGRPLSSSLSLVYLTTFEACPNSVTSSLGFSAGSDRTRQPAFLIPPAFPALCAIS